MNMKIVETKKICRRFRIKNFMNKKIVLQKLILLSVLLIRFVDINQVRPSDESAKQLFLNYVLKIGQENTINIQIIYMYV